MEDRTPREPSRLGRRVALATAALLLAASCASRDDDPSPRVDTAAGGATTGGSAGDETAAPACPVAEMNRFVAAGMNDYYLFADRVPPLLPDAYDAPEEYIRALRVAPDRFSYVGDAALNAEYFDDGLSYGYGWILERADDGHPILALVQPGSPLDDAGAMRGDHLVAVGGVRVEDIASAEQERALLGSGRDVKTVTMTLENSAGDERTISVTRGGFAIRAVTDLEVFDVGGSRVGYLHFLTFVETARAELDDAFRTLAAAGVDELVLDLRYNGGGRIDVAADLGSRIVGDGGRGRDFVRFRYNDRYQRRFEAEGLADELRLPFRALPDSLDLPRVHVLATGRTCSASEMVVNALAPLMDVVVVGGTSCGKPFGTQGREFCDKVMQAVEVEFVNDSGVGGYADGIPAACAADDDPTRALGDPAEGLLAAALAHIADGRCEAPGATFAARSRAVASAPVTEPTNPYRDELSSLPAVPR